MRYLLFGLTLICYSWTAIAKPQNLDFSEVKNDAPAHWFIAGSEPENFIAEHPTGSGNSLRLTRKSDTDAEYAFAVQMLPFDYQGSELQLSGWIRTENVELDGGAALWLRLDSGQSMLLLDNMEQHAVTGSQDWQKFSITVPLSATVDSLAFGALLSGAGQADFADLQLLLDGTSLAEVQQPVFLAEQPHEFEQDSGIRFSALTSAQQQDLATLAKVWGFIKYYHPASAAGMLSLDAELFRLIPQIMASDKTSRDTILLNWINSLGGLEPCNACKDPDKSALVHPEQHWLPWGLSSDLNALLAQVYTAEMPHRHFWVRAAPGVGNPVFNEKPYPDASYEDTGFRLLTVFRLWNIIHYYSPYRDLTEQPWEQVLHNAIAEVVSATTETDYQLAIAKAIYAIHDTHSQFWPASNEVLTKYLGQNIVPAEVRFVEGQAVVRLVYQPELPIKIGDVITHINGSPVSERLEYLRPLTAASNEPTRLRNFARNLLRDNSEQLSLQILRKDQVVQLKLPLVAVSSLQREHLYNTHGEDAYQRLAQNIGYIRLDKIKGVNIDQMMAALADTAGLIIDIRNYPSEFVVFSLGTHLYPEAYPFVRFTTMLHGHPGQFNWTEPLYVGASNPEHYQGKIVILVNELTQSQAEYTTMAFRGAPKAMVMGSTTAGADGNVSEILLPGGHRTMLSGIGVFYPDKTPTQGIGILPDIEVTPTLAGIAAGRDEVLEQAISLLQP